MQAAGQQPWIIKTQSQIHRSHARKDKLIFANRNLGILACLHTK
jgi:hypothetical protein